MRKISIALLLSLVVFVPFIASASFDKNLYYGLQNDPQINELQEFLTDQGVYSGPITGNFFSLTLKAVKQFQTQQDLPQTGYFGVLSRQKANDILTANTAEANQEAIQETSTTVPPVETPKTTNDVVNSLQNQMVLLLQQLALLQSQMTTLNQIQQNTQQIAQNTCVQNWQCTAWTACENSKQTRTCTDSNNCGVATNKPIETQSCSSLPTVEEKNLKDYKIKYLGFIPIEIMEKPLEKNPTIDYYQADFIIDTVVPAKSVKINATGGRQQTYISQSEALGGTELYLKVWVLYPDESNWMIEIKDNSGNVVVYENLVIKNKIEKIELPTPPASFNNYTEEVNWINAQTDTRLDKCEEYRGREFGKYTDCLKNKDTAPEPVVQVVPGSLSVAASSASSDQTVAIGSVTIPYLNLTLTAGNQENIRMVSIKFARNSSGSGSDSDISNIAIYEGATRITMKKNLTSGSVTFAASDFMNSSGIDLTKNQQKTIAVKADVPSTASAGHQNSLGIINSSDIIFAGLASNQTPTPTLTAGPGSCEKINASCTVALDAYEVTLITAP